LTAVIDRRRKQLQRRAFDLGPELYGRSPKQFAERIGRGSRERARPPETAAA
jgi:hypothetical protein